MAQQALPAALADRYGRRPSGGGGRGGRGARARLVRIVALAVFVAAALAWAFWAATASDRAGVTWRDGPFALVDDGHARLTFEVTTQPGRRVVCTVRLFNQGMTEVGRTDVRAGPAPRRTFSVTVTVPTFEAATAGTVRACAVA